MLWGTYIMCCASYSDYTFQSSNEPLSIACAIEKAKSIRERGGPQHDAEEQPNSGSSNKNSNW